MRGERAFDRAAPSEAADLVREHGAAVGRVCMALLGENDAAQAATEEAFFVAIEAFGARSTSESPRSDRGWLFGIVRGVCAKRLESDPSPTTKRYGSIQDAAHAAKSPSARVRLILAELRPSEREPTVLRWVAGLTLAEIAEACRIDEETARARVSRGLARLRTSLA